MQGPAGKFFKFYFGISFLILSLVLAYAPADVDDLKVGSNVCSEDDRYISNDYSYNAGRIKSKIIDTESDDRGRVYIPYLGSYYEESEVKSVATIEHIVARKNAHDSGLCNKSSGTRKRFANDLLNITLAPSSLNSAKGHDTVDDWMPPRNMCWFAYTIVQVKDKYNLVVTPAEKAKLKSIWDGCDGNFKLEKDR